LTEETYKTTYSAVGSGFQRCLLRNHGDFQVASASANVEQAWTTSCSPAELFHCRDHVLINGDNNMFRKTKFAAAMASVILTQTCLAAVGSDEAKLLGGDKLTSFGSERGGNKEGTIPPYSGKAPKAPAGYDLKDPGQRPDPYGDKPQFTITAQNYTQYAGKLDGMAELFKRYPDFRMDIYPSHRDYAYPQYVLDNTARNAVSCNGEKAELKLEGCYGGFPFPIPKTGNQVMWNHLLQYEAAAYAGVSQSWITPTDGKGLLQARILGFQQFDYFDPNEHKPILSNSIYWKFIQTDVAPARRAGNKLVILDSLDMAGEGRRVFQYLPGQRRVKLAPNLAYDTPSPNTGGASTMDDAKGFLGALDRYDFKLIGKKEKYIMYDNFSMSNFKACPDEKIADNKNFPNPECVRWELHRVWEVQATLKPGLRHIYVKRNFFWDEDAPGSGSVENYDATGKLYRVVNEMSLPYYDNELGAFSDASIELDLQTGIWTAQGLTSMPGTGWHTVARKDDRAFSPEAIAGDGVR